MSGPNAALAADSLANVASSACTPTQGDMNPEGSADEGTASLRTALAQVARFEAIWHAAQVQAVLDLARMLAGTDSASSAALHGEKEHKNRLLEHRLAQLEAREQSTTAFHTTLVQNLDTCANKLKNAVRECNAHQEKIEELEAELIEAQNTSATLRRELEEKNVELVREEKKRKLQVDEAMREGREKMEHCQNMMREEAKAEMKKLVEEHARSQQILELQYKEKMIAHSLPSGSRTTTSATVSEALLKQKLEQAQTDIAALKEELKEAKAAATTNTKLAGEHEAVAGKRIARKYVISSDSDSDGNAFAPQTSKGRVASPPAVQGKQRQGAKKGPAAKQAPAAKKTGLSKQSTLRQRREEGSSGRAKATLQLEAHDPFDYFD